MMTKYKVRNILTIKKAALWCRFFVYKFETYNLALRALDSDS